MAQSTTVETDGVQIKVWIPSAFYDLLKAQATRNQTSVAAEARRLMQAGLAPLDTLGELKSDLTELSQFARLHLEPLAFVAAMDSAKTAEYWYNQVRTSRVGKNDGDEAKGTEEAKNADRIFAERATKRIQRKLRNLEPEGQANTDGDTEEAD